MSQAGRTGKMPHEGDEKQEQPVILGTAKPLQGMGKIT